MSCQRSALRKTWKILVSTAKTTKLASVSPKLLILAVESKLLKKLLSDEQFLNGTSAQCTRPRPLKLIAFRCAVFDCVIDTFSEKKTCGACGFIFFLKHFMLFANCNYYFELGLYCLK